MVPPRSVRWATPATSTDVTRPERRSRATTAEASCSVSRAKLVAAWAPPAGPRRPSSDSADLLSRPNSASASLVTQMPESLRSSLRTGKPGATAAKATSTTIASATMAAGNRASGRRDMGVTFMGAG